jgi:hypothetical protein
MGGLVGGIFDLAAGDPTKHEQDTLGTLGNEQIGTGENLVTPAATYYENILSGDPTKIAQSLAPEISAGQSQVEQQRLTGSQFGTRSGGTTASGNAAESQERGNIINLVGGLQKSTADSAASLGSQQESAGAGNITTQADMAAKNQQRMTGDVSGIASDVASIATGVAGGGGGGGGDPYQSIYNANHTATSDAGLNPEQPDLSGEMIQ